MKAFLLILCMAAATAVAGVCKGDDPCKACKDCSACKWCDPKNPKRGSCGVCRDQDGAAAKKRDAKRR